MRGFIKAARLEFNQLSENKLNIVFLFLLPVLIIVVFGYLKGEPWSISNLRITNFDLYTPVVLPIVIFFITCQLTVLRIVGERAPLGTLDRDLLAISRSGMYLGKLTTNAIIAFLQCLIILITTILFGVQIQGDVITVFVVLYATSLAGLSAGLFFSVISKSKEQAVQLVPFASLILLLLSGAVMPIPSNLKQITSATPLALSYSSLSIIMLSCEDIVGALSTGSCRIIQPRLFSIADKITLLLVWSVVFTICGLVKFELEGK
jgi:ABC-type polysaccharide/polyol phosphate export permease